MCTTDSRIMTAGPGAVIELRGLQCHQQVIMSDQFYQRRPPCCADPPSTRCPLSTHCPAGWTAGSLARYLIGRCQVAVPLINMRILPARNKRRSLARYTSDNNDVIHQLKKASSSRLEHRLKPAQDTTSVKFTSQ